MRHAIDHRFVARAQVAQASLAAGGAAMAFLSSNMTIFAAVDLLALVGSIFFIWRAARRMWRFIGVWRLTSFRRALWRSRHAALKQAFRCATDEIYYLSRLTLLFSANLLAVGAVIFAALGAAHSPGGTWKWIADVVLLLFAAFAIRAFHRTVSLARKVLEIRRRLRTVSFRWCRRPLARR